MNTPPENDFPEVRRLLIIKRHEQPPPGYFHHFSSRVIASLSEERTTREEGAASLSAWILRFLERLQSRPAFAGAMGAGMCALVIGGILFYEKGSTTPTAMPSLLSEVTSGPQLFQPASATRPAAVAFQPVPADATTTLLASNSLQFSPSPSLFDAIPGLDTVTVGHRP